VLLGEGKGVEDDDLQQIPSGISEQLLPVDISPAPQLFLHISPVLHPEAFFLISCLSWVKTIPAVVPTRRAKIRKIFRISFLFII